MHSELMRWTFIFSIFISNIKSSQTSLSFIMQPNVYKCFASFLSLPHKCFSIIKQLSINIIYVVFHPKIIKLFIYFSPALLFPSNNKVSIYFTFSNISLWTFSLFSHTSHHTAKCSWMCGFPRSQESIFLFIF